MFTRSTIRLRRSLAAAAALVGGAVLASPSVDAQSDIDTAPGFDGETITVGALTPTSGRVAVIGGPVTVGNQIYFEALNAQGGVAGQYPVEIEVRDTKYEPATAAQEYQATKDDVALYVQVLGTPVVSALLPDFEADGIVASPASLDSFWVREPNLLPWGGPYQIQVINGFSWYVTEGGGADATICSLTQDDAYGETGLEGLHFAAEQLGFDIAAEVTFTLGTTDYTTQVNQLESAGCEGVLLTATPADAAGVLAKAAQVGFEPQWLAQSPGFLKLLFEGDLKDYAEAHLVVLAEGGAWAADASPGMADLITALETYAPDQAPDWYLTVGWTQARAVHQVLEAAVANGDLSREGIVEAMNGLDVITADGLFGDYGWGPPEERDPPRTSTIYGVDIAGSPIGLVPVAQDYTSDAAAAFSFDD